MTPPHFASPLVRALFTPFSFSLVNSQKFSVTREFPSGYLYSSPHYPQRHKYLAVACFVLSQKRVQPHFEFVFEETFYELFFSSHKSGNKLTSNSNAPLSFYRHCNKSVHSIDKQFFIIVSLYEVDNDGLVVAKFCRRLFKGSFLSLLPSFSPPRCP